MKIIKINDLPDSCSETIKLLVPSNMQRGHIKDDPQKIIESGLINLKAIGKLIRINNWANKDVLDYGCGAKFTQTIVQYGLSIRNYVGIDVHEELIDFLIENIKLPNLQFYKVSFKNEMYNKGGISLTPGSVLPCKIDKFDIILLQSVFTHFNPKDFASLLHVLKIYSKYNTRLFFTCFIDNKMNEDFYSDPKHFLLRAYYKENFVKKMLKDSGWSVKSITPPSSGMQHQFVCRPTSNNFLLRLFRNILTTFSDSLKT